MRATKQSFHLHIARTTRLVTFLLANVAIETQQLSTRFVAAINGSRLTAVEHGRVLTIRKRSLDLNTAIRISRQNPTFNGTLIEK